ncbi:MULTISPECIES: hypothetical protein [Methanosarcina]|uniref:Uncharacterized protein n=1 Tax=Methanosarcina barkeri 3 TaxID=1434107 RepID=A0A0E3SKD9_METBA|nr:MULTISPECIES: hypothetical protein [Methanosarcina]AKB80958.1 hypothetical protein MSBR3_0380 [Methanosarcina barkeri 3]MDW5549778.1 hypothetical protein [Methanosarcina sp.]MDW5555676.1 hypothetical protein [Methanosarcina sp.]MDW5561135.1 hypothetical protein [Methanosarcina sp.]
MLSARYAKKIQKNSNRGLEIDSCHAFFEPCSLNGFQRVFLQSGGADGRTFLQVSMMLFSYMPVPYLYHA